MLTQHYKLPVTEEILEEGCPGQMVFQSDVSSDVIGFIDFISDAHVCIMLFEPTEINANGAIQISETCDWEPRMREIMEEDLNIARMWLDEIVEL